jgi:hypothetical protein
MCLFLERKFLKLKHCPNMLKAAYLQYKKKENSLEILICHPIKCCVKRNNLALLFLREFKRYLKNYFFQSNVHSCQVSHMKIKGEQAEDSNSGQVTPMEIKEEEAEDSSSGQLTHMEMKEEQAEDSNGGTASELEPGTPKPTQATLSSHPFFLTPVLEIKRPLSERQAVTSAY